MKKAHGGGYGLHRGIKGSAQLSTAVPAYGNVHVRPGLHKQMPGSPKSGHGHVRPAKVITGKK